MKCGYNYLGYGMAEVMVRNFNRHINNRAPLASAAVLFIDTMRVED
jgi:hypothetical protein